MARHCPSFLNAVAFARWQRLAVGPRGHWRWHRSIGHITIVVCNSHVSISYLFLDIQRRVMAYVPLKSELGSLKVIGILTLPCLTPFFSLCFSFFSFCCYHVRLLSVTCYCAFGEFRRKNVKKRFKLRLISTAKEISALYNISSKLMRQVSK